MDVSPKTVSPKQVADILINLPAAIRNHCICNIAPDVLAMYAESVFKGEMTRKDFRDWMQWSLDFKNALNGPSVTFLTKDKG